MTHALGPMRRIRCAAGRTYARLLTRIARPLISEFSAECEATLRRVTDEMLREQYHQLESLTAIYNTLDIRVPLPPMREWAVSPDFGCELVRLIRRYRPEHILELGSGVSTLLACYALRANGSGRITSLDHDARWGARTESHIHEHGFDASAHIVHAPLGGRMIDTTLWQWYDSEVLPSLPDVDLLIIDGPPASVGPLARYPALPVLIERLKRSSVVVLDDSDRPDELEIVERWNAEFGPFEVERPTTEKGMAILRRPPPDRE